MPVLTITGSMCDIWPVSSNTITDVEIVWVTLPDKAAAPARTIKPQIANTFDIQNLY